MPSELLAQSAPLSADAHLVDSGDGLHLLVPNGNRLYAVDAELHARIDRLLRAGDDAGLTALLQDIGVDGVETVAVGDEQV